MSHSEELTKLIEEITIVTLINPNVTFAVVVQDNTGYANYLVLESLFPEVISLVDTRPGQSLVPPNR